MVVSVSRTKRVRILSVEWDTAHYFKTTVNETTGKTKVPDKNIAVCTLVAWAVEYPLHDGLYDPNRIFVLDAGNEFLVEGYEPEEITNDMVCVDLCEDDENEEYVPLPKRRVPFAVGLTLTEEKLHQVPALELDSIAHLSKEEICIAGVLRKAQVTPLLIHNCLDHYSLETVNEIMVRRFGMWPAPGANRKEAMYTLIEELFEPKG